MEERPAGGAFGEGGGRARRTAADEAAGGSGWVTTDVAAAALGVSPRTVRRYIERGDLAGRVEEEGITKAWLVSIDSLQALRDRRGPAGHVREEAADASAVADSLAEVLERMSARLEARTAEAADARARLELTERAESTLREERDTVRQELGAERERRERAERERDELAARLAALEEARESPQTATEGAEGEGERLVTEEVQTEASEPRRGFLSLVGKIPFWQLGLGMFSWVLLNAISYTLFYSVVLYGVGIYDRVFHFTFLYAVALPVPALFGYFVGVRKTPLSIVRYLLPVGAVPGTLSFLVFILVSALYGEFRLQDLFREPDFALLLVAVIAGPQLAVYFFAGLWGNARQRKRAEASPEFVESTTQSRRWTPDQQAKLGFYGTVITSAITAAASVAAAMIQSSANQ